MNALKKSIRIMHSNICNKSHRYDEYFKLLPENQGQNAGHKCSGCAYELGILHAISGLPKAKNDSVLKQIPYSQAGAVRHKDAFIAYQTGYAFALKEILKIAA